jgi:hypothetical protein
MFDRLRQSGIFIDQPIASLSVKVIDDESLSAVRPVENTVSMLPPILVKSIVCSNLAI